MLSCCEGTRTWPNGDRYAGSFKHGMQDGEANWDDLTIHSCVSEKSRISQFRVTYDMILVM